jgi:hypothetical protein
VALGLDGSAVSRRGCSVYPSSGRPQRLQGCPPLVRYQVLQREAAALVEQISAAGVFPVFVVGLPCPVPLPARRANG